MKRRIVSLTASAVLLMSMYTGIGSAETPYGTLDENGGLHLLAGAVTPTDLSVSLTGEENLYDAPSESATTGITLAPQTVHAVAVNDSFFKINTWLGDKWISPKNNIIFNLEASKTVLTLSSITPIYDLPNGYGNPAAELSPQEIESFEKAAGGWYHIHTWLGDKWIKPSIALPKDPEKVNTNIELVAGAALLQYPSVDAKVVGVVPQTPIQTVTAFEKINGWYHVHTSVGDGWILVDETINAPSNYIVILPQKVDKVINLKTETQMYSNPATGQWLAKLSPQEIQAVEVWNENWYKIHSWLGDAWILVQQ